MSIKFRFLLFSILLLFGLGLSACETMQGAGRDIGNAGQSIENAAE